MDKKETGRLGEKLAVDFLRSKDYSILETNFTTRLGEIDIIAQKDSCLVFVEVKTRKNLSYGRPYEAVNYRKMQKIIRVAENYINYKSSGDVQCRFDIIEVFLMGDTKINHIKDAFWL